MKDCDISCVDCGIFNCKTHDSKYPDFCPTTNLSQEKIDEINLLYEDCENRRVSRVAAEIEADFYCKYTRVEEIIEFARRMNYKKIGIATCLGLIEESKIFAKILRKNGFEVFSAACKMGSMKKTDTVGVSEDKTIVTGNIMCNPILQAKFLDNSNVDFNVVIGLCVGHDSLFYKYSNTLSTTLITKDRVLGHNPAVALYQVEAYYKKLLE